MSGSVILPSLSVWPHLNLEEKEESVWSYGHTELNILEEK